MTDLGVASRSWVALVSEVIPILFATLVAVWTTIAVVRLVGFVRARRVLARRVANRVPIMDRVVVARARVLAGGSPIRISVSSRIRTPMILASRELCLPRRALTELTTSELDAVLAHEIAHLHRRDAFWLSLTGIVERVLWVQPLNALAAARLRALAECWCDDWALHRIQSPVALASALARVAEWLGGTPAPHLAVGMASHESLALARVRRILDPSVERLAVRHRPINSVVTVCALAAVVLAAPGFSSQGIRYTIQAHDDGGPFTLTLEHGVVIGMTVDGLPVVSSRLERDGAHLRVRDAEQRVALDLTLTPSGGIRWTSRPARAAVAH